MPTFRERVMTKKEVAAYVGVSTKSVDRGFGDCLQPFKLGGLVLFDKEQVIRHFNNVLKNRGRCDGDCANEAIPAQEIGSRLRQVK
jgi:hypothetical protein